MLRRLAIPFTLLVVIALLPAAAFGQEEMPAPADMSPEQQAMMEAWMKAATPGEEHAGLAEHTGKWKATVKSWMDPSAEPQVTEGSFHRELILDGRVLEEHFEGSFEDQTFVGYGLTGYDNVTQRWWSTWNDNMSTGLIVMWGEWDEKEEAIVYHGQGPDPMTGTMVENKIIVRHPEEDKEIMEMYDMRSGEPVKTMEIVSTRQ